MRLKLNGGWVRLLGMALLLSACAPPATSLATTAPTQPATATALPPTEAANLSTSTMPAKAGVSATSIQLFSPSDIAFDFDGNLYVAQCSDRRAAIVKVGEFNMVTEVVGAGSGVSGDGGPALKVGLGCTASIAFDVDGSLYVANVGNNRVRRIDPYGIISTVAGAGPAGYGIGGDGGDGGPAIDALLNGPTEVAFDLEGNLLIADSGNHRIRKVDRQGIITTLAGTGEAGFSGDNGPATAAQLNLGHQKTSGGAFCGTGIAVDAEGSIYFGDTLNFRIRKIDRQGIITTVAGTSAPGTAGDGGLATIAQLLTTCGLAFDMQGSLYVTVATSHAIADVRIRKIDLDGIITTVAGTGELGFSGDDGPATSAELRGLAGLGFDSLGNLFFADSGNNRIRKVDRKGIITTVVGGAP